MIIRSMQLLGSKIWWITQRKNRTCSEQNVTWRDSYIYGKKAFFL